MKNLNDLPLVKNLTSSDLRGKRVFLRLDLNLPIVDGKVVDDFRLKRSLPTIRFLLERGARVIIASHLGGAGESLAPIASALGKFIPVEFADAWDGVEEKAAEVKAGHALLLENLRQDPGEEGNDKAFAKRLAALADLYINDAFAASHREHASIVGVAKLLPNYLGLIFEEEVRELSLAFTPNHPFLLILGGAKFGTKLPLVQKFLPIADRIFLGGALAHSFFQSKGYELGRSLVEKDVSMESLVNEPKIILPSDVRVQNGERVFIKRPTELVPEDKILDMGLESVEKLLLEISRAKLILWNGPLGSYEQGWRGGTDAVARFIAASNAHSIVGGGDTIASIQSLNLLDQFNFVSTGGGAMLDFLATGTLPGLEAITHHS